MKNRETTTARIAKSIRKTWTINPRERVHSSPKGKRGYRRVDTRKAEREW